MNLLTVGSVAYDTIKTPFGKANKTLGGSASYFSVAAGYFTKPMLVAVVGSDFKAGDIALLKNKGVDVSGLEQKTGKTFHWAGKYSFDLNSRDTLKTELGVFADFSPRLSQAHKSAQYIFLGNIHPKLQLNVLEQIKKPKFVGLDTMNYWIEKAPRDLSRVLKLIDILIINDSEARELSKQQNLLKTAKKILAMMRKQSTLIIKRGEYGLLMFGDLSPSPSGRGARGEGSKIFNLPGFPLEDVTDPTGAGDSFAGGFMGYLSASNSTSWENLKRACVTGSTMASFCVEEMGVKGLLGVTKNDINQRLKDFKLLTEFEN